jgi:hypothetical protein
LCESAIFAELGLGDPSRTSEASASAVSILSGACHVVKHRLLIDALARNKKARARSRALVACTLATALLFAQRAAHAIA